MFVPIDGASQNQCRNGQDVLERISPPPHNLLPAVGGRHRSGADAMTTYQWDDVAYVSGLQGRPDLNNRAARVCKPAPRGDGRIGIEMFIGQERAWIKPANLTPIPNVEALSTPKWTVASRRS